MVGVSSFSVPETHQLFSSYPLLLIIKGAEMEQHPMVLPPPMSSTCLFSVEKLQPMNKFNQRSEKMQKQRKTDK